MGEFPLQFEHPMWLWLLLLIVPAYLIARRSVGASSRLKTTITFALRLIVILLLATALSNPTWQRTGEGLTVTVVLDRSYSIPLPLLERSVEFFKEAATYRDNDADRLASITLGKDAQITATPDRYAMVNTGVDEPDRSATNLAAGIRLAMAIMPDDTANRIVLVSDGNETVESVMAAADMARANNIPIDVMVLEYEHTNEVIFERIAAPARARLGQSINLRMVLRSQSHASGQVYLRMNGELLDLDPASEGNGLQVDLEPGVRVIPVTLRLDDPGPAQFEAVFEPASPADDTIHQNNRALAVTFVGGEGRILVLDEGTGDSEQLVRAMQQAGINYDRQPPEALAGGLVFLSGYDAVILANVARWSFDDAQDRMLHAYVHDLGGGLIMLGGPQSFGAGGWIESRTADALPVRLDPPQTRQMPRGALALIMHSCEMPQGNYWSQEVARAAINALSRMDYIGIVEWNWAVRENAGATWALPMQIAGDKQAALAATRQLVVGDTKDFGPLMQLAYDGLTSVNAGQKHVIIISDGDPSAPRSSILQAYIDAKITVTTIMVIGHGNALDRARMQMIANQTGGRFYHILNPTQLPQIFIKESQLVSRSLIQEGEFQPQVVSRLPGPTEGFGSVPGINGYVLTAMREGLTQTPIVHRTSEGDDPIYAHWNYGLGRSIAYTSDLMGRWGSPWVTWNQFQAFWSQSIRWVMRPSSPTNLTINTRLEGDMAVIEVEALGTDASFLNFLQTRAVVLQPDNTAEPLPLQQTGPGRYRGSFRTDQAGAYLVNVNYSTPGATDGEGQGNMQAAVTVPYSREFRDVTHNAALMRQIAEATGGRVLSGTDPSTVDLFYREQLAVPRSAKHIWDLLAMIAAGLFLLDVAARRIAVDQNWVRSLLGRAVGRRGAAGDETVSAWKRAREQVAHRKPTDQSGDARSRRSVRFEADEADKAQAISVGEDGPTDTSRSSDKPSEKKTPKDQPPDEQDGDYTSRLLAAKRRARKPDDDKS
jgi:uncharacterized membrane protein